jgi:UDP-N-acetylmuramoylalanine--D-glutamate ligase
MSDWTGKRVLILGAARQGAALARWLARHGSQVILSDTRNEEQMSPVLESLAGLSIRWVLGGHPIELLEHIDLLCLSGGVPLNLPIVEEALRRGIPLSNDTQIFLEAAPCRTIGITGSAGKTTTTTLVGEMAKLSMETDARQHAGSPVSARPAAAFVGGNIGDPLINYVDEMQADDLAILEISSFQLEQMTISPNVAAILNVTPNHLDRHGTMEAYTEAKARILDFQSPDDTAVLGRDDPGTWALRERVKGRLLAFSLNELEQGLDGAYLQDDLLSMRAGVAYVPLLLREKVKLRGDHNVSNVLAAFAIGLATGWTLDAMLEAVEEFRGVPHRLELVRELHGVRWYNDSIATAPERTMAAIRSFEEPIVLLLGGRDKDLPWGGLAGLVRQRVKHVVLFGEAAGKIRKALSESGADSATSLCETLEQAVARAAELAESGDVVLLSPGGTSYDAFKDFAERGERFREWVSAL